MSDETLFIPNGHKPTKAPAFQFYPGDWRRDLALRACSQRARGLWMDLLCLMHDGTPYGHLATEHGPLTDPRELAGMVGMPVGHLKVDLEELKAKGVCSLTDEGIIYSRRMVRDQTVRARRALGGYKSIGHPKTHPPRVPSDPPSDPPLGVPPASAPASASASAKKETTLSGTHRPTALSLLAFLNEKAGKSYRAGDVNLGFIVSRLKDGATEGDCRAVIARKVREWKGTEQEQYLRPETLFNRTKFESYLGQRAPEGAPHADHLP